MAQIDVKKVKGKMAEHDLNVSSFAKIIGVSRTTLTKYIGNPGKIPYEIVSKMADILCDTPEEANAIFFADDLRNT